MFIRQECVGVEVVGALARLWYSSSVAASDSNKPTGSGNEPFDAVKAAEELAASLGMETGPGNAAVASSAAYEETLERELEQLNALLDAKDAKIAELEQAVEAVGAARDQAHDQLHDEVEKVSARIVKEELKKRDQKHRKMLLEFLEVLDDFDRSLEAIAADGHPEAILAGVKIVHTGLVRRLAELGVVHYGALAAKFDPNVHDAVTTVPVKDAAQDGTVIAVVREGYMLGEECLRPARVAVGKRS